jgi:hypothetical protein
MTFRRPFALLVAALLVGACGPTTPTPSPAQPTPGATGSAQASQPAGSSGPVASGAAGSGDPGAAAIYADIRAGVIAIRGLQPAKSVDPVTIDETQLRANLAAEFDKENPPAELRASEDTLIALGLLPAGASMKAIMLDFQGSQVAGYYSPEQDRLFVISRSGELGATEEVTYAHEFTHQLQDQDIGLDKLGIDVADQSDRSLARLSLVEGDAVSVQTAWMLANLTPEQMGELLQSALDPAAMEALQRAPMFVRETALFPYQDGFRFVTGLATTGGYAAVDAAYKAPPDSTEQIIHPEKYAAHEAPVTVALPAGLAAAAGAGWSVASQDTLGELITRVWLTAGGMPAAQASAAAAGWGGDRLALVRGPNDATGIAWISEWDTPADADEVAAAATTTLGALGLQGSAEHAAGSTRVAIVLGPTAAQLVGALGT